MSQEPEFSMDDIKEIEDAIKDNIAEIDEQLAPYLHQFSIYWDPEIAYLEVHNHNEDSISSVNLVESDNEDENENTLYSAIDYAWIIVRDAIFKDAFDADGNPNFALLNDLDALFEAREEEKEVEEEVTTNVERTSSGGGIPKRPTPNNPQRTGGIPTRPASGGGIPKPKSSAVFDDLNSRVSEGGIPKPRNIAQPEKRGGIPTPPARPTGGIPVPKRTGNPR